MDMDSISENVGDPQPADSQPASESSVSEPKVVSLDEAAAEPAAKTKGTGPRKFALPRGEPDKHWWIKHKKALVGVEWGLAALLIVVALYYFWFLLFPAETVPEPAGPPPTVEEFRVRVRELPAIPADPAWEAANLSPRWRKIVVHHSATPSGSAEIFDRVHREERKWENGLGYHFVIGNGKGMEDGGIFVGQRWKDQLDGAHIRGPKGENLNTQSIGIALVGNFENSLPTAKQLAALKGLINYLRQTCRISLADVVGHNEISERKTLCPGSHFYMDELKLAIANP